ncbi:MULTISPECIES: hypothetical protein [Pirellulaceae]|nr:MULTISPECIES: hypothetical protein [Pirellulaceae]
MLLAQNMPGMEYVPLILFCLLLGFSGGLLAILLAFLRQVNMANWLAKGSIGLAVASTLFILPAAWHEARPVLYLMMLSPIGLAVVALMIAELSKGLPPISRLKFGLVLVVFFIPIVAGAIAFAISNNAAYYHDRDQIVLKFEGMEDVTDVVIDGYDYEGVWYVGAVCFTIKGKPGSLITMCSKFEFDDCHVDEPLDRLQLIQLGDCRFFDEGAYLTEGMIPQTFRNDSLELGRYGNYGDLLPMQVESIRDVIENYDELLSFFHEQWPQKEMPGHLEREEKHGRRVFTYWMEVDPKVLTPQEANLIRTEWP